MTSEMLDTTGLKCPQPVLKLAVIAPRMKTGESLIIKGDCPTFERDIRTWCERLGKTLLSCQKDTQGVISIDILF